MDKINDDENMIILNELLDSPITTPLPDPNMIVLLQLLEIMANEDNNMNIEENIQRIETPNEFDMEMAKIEESFININHGRKVPLMVVAYMHKKYRHYAFSDYAKRVYFNIINSFITLGLAPFILIIALHNICRIIDSNTTQETREDCLASPCYFAVCINLAAKFYHESWYLNSDVIYHLQRYAEVPFSSKMFNTIESTLYKDYEFRPSFEALDLYIAPILKNGRII
jgi:hypothetical protein